jgi:MFS family permease
MEMAGNPGRYVWFVALYNARAYYPILAILFLDLGLTLDQYVMLNLIWAATIFLFEVPSGALADTFGRKKLLVTASLLMVAEMSCLLFAPKDGGWLLFSICVVNRLLSGLSEAAASGADEALAYDSLPEKNREEAWDAVLARAMRLRSVAYVFAMILGGLMYDPAVVNRVLPESWAISATLAHRLPVALVLVQALFCVVITLRMVEPKKVCHESLGKACGDVLKLTLSTAKWVFTNPATLLMTTLGFLGFTMSRALNRETDSARRATVLSVKGLAFNLAYGSFSLGFSLLLASFPVEPVGDALRGALVWQIPFFTVTVFGLFWWGKRRLRRVTH